MKILLDHCLPRRIAIAFPTHQVSTTADQGWQALRNGNLLTAAAARFDVLFTIDKNLKHEQNLKKLPISIVVFMAKSNRLVDLLPLVPAVEMQLNALPPNSFIEVSRSQ